MRTLMCIAAVLAASYSAADDKIRVRIDVDEDTEVEEHFEGADIEVDVSGLMDAVDAALEAVSEIKIEIPDTDQFREEVRKVVRDARDAVRHTQRSVERFGDSFVVATLPSIAYLGPIMEASLGQYREIDESRPFHSGGEVRIENVAGSVEVIGWDREEIRVEGKLGEDVEQLEFRVDAGEADIEVEIPRRGKNRKIASELTIHVPNECTLEVETVSAGIDVRGISGGRHDLESVSGNINVRETTGEVDAECISGSITIEGPGGAVDVEAISGSITVTGSSPRVDAESISGRIKIDTDAKEVRAESVSGRIEVVGQELDRFEAGSVSGRVGFRGALAGDGRIKVDTVSGSVVIEFTDEGFGRYDVLSFSGGIHNEFGPDTTSTSTRGPRRPRLQWDHGAGSARIYIETFSGSVTLRNQPGAR